MSLSLYVQQVGRGLRPYPGKVDCVILDHAGNTLRHGRIEDYEPPQDLSEVDKTTDKKSRKSPALTWVCRHCDAVNELTDDTCVECGAARFRASSVVIVDGQLQQIDHEPGDELPGPSVAEIEAGYRMLLYFARSKGLSPGWAFYAAQRRFGIDSAAARFVLPYRLRALPPIPPDDACSRWLRADYQRQLVARSYGQQRRGYA